MHSWITYHGIRIRPHHRKVYRRYLLGCWMPFCVGAGIYAYWQLYPLLIQSQQSNSVEPSLFLFPIIGSLLLLFVPLSILLFLRRSSFLKGGFFYRVYQRQMLARMLESNGIYEKKEVKGKNTTREKITFPKVYYRTTKEYLYLRVPTDGMKWHDRFTKIAKTFEEMYLADFIDEQHVMGATTYTLMTDVQSKRIGIHDCVVTNGRVQLMQGVVWDYAEVPHMLITGGTGGGKSATRSWLKRSRTMSIII